MKRSDVRAVLHRLGTDLGSDWSLTTDVFTRRLDHWVQLLGIAPGAGAAPKFRPFSVLDFLALELSPGLLLGNCGGQRLQGPRYPVDRWVSLREFEGDPATIIHAMKEQFRPAIDSPLTHAAIDSVVSSATDDWGCMYGAALDAALRGNRAEALEWLERFNAYVADRPLENRVADLSGLLLLDDEALAQAIAPIELAKLGGAAIPGPR